MKKRTVRKQRFKGSLRIRVIFVVFIATLLSGIVTSFLFLFGGYFDFLPFQSPTSVVLIFSLLLCSVVIGTVFSSIIAPIAIKPFRQIKQASDRIANGDYTTRLPVAEKDRSEIASILRSFNHMAEELNSIELFRNDFINNFSHEFKTPIVSIRGFAKQLMENDQLTDEQKNEYLRIIFNESARLSRMSENVLLLNKLENQQIVSDRTLFSLDEQIRTCVLLMQRQWEEKEIELRLELEEASYYSNEEMLSHVWINLFNNAIKFTPVGGVIAIDMHCVPNYVCVGFSDSGCGMTEEVRRRVFEKFYQGDPSHSMQGNGIGLTITNRIVTLCGGYIAVESAPGQGSRFTVVLPATAVSATPANANERQRV